MFEDLKQLLVRKFQVEPDAIVPEALFEELGLDSLDLVELALTLESEFGLRISEDELAEARKINDVIRLSEIRAGTS